MPSAPCRFSTTTGWPQRSVSRSETSRADRSMPLPGGSGTMKRTVFCGQVCACAWTGVSSRTTTRALANRTKGCMIFHVSTEEAYGNGTDRVERERDAVFARLDDERRHDRAGDDDLAFAQPLAEGAEHVGDVAHDVDPRPGIRLRTGGAGEIEAAPEDAAGQAFRRAAGARRGGAREHHMALVHVVAQHALDVLRRLVHIDQLNRRRDARDRGSGRVTVGAGRHVAADVCGDFGLRHRVRPAGERHAPAGLDSRVLRQEADQWAADPEACEHRRRAEPDLPAERPVAGIDTLASQGKLRGHAAYDARVVP